MFGGTFNPPHLGHLVLARELLTEFHVDRLLLVPCFIPPHKLVEDDPGAEERLAMTRLLMSYDPRIEVLDWEIRAKSVSYTVETLERIACAPEYQDSLAGEKPYLVIGDDLAGDFFSWKNPKRILEIANVIVARRTLNNAPVEFPHRDAHNVLVEISSTLVRHRIQKGTGWEWLCPAEVCAFIKERGLYGVLHG